MIKDSTDLETGEVITVKPYETDKHREIKAEVAKQIAYINRTLKDEQGQLSKLDGDTLSLVLMELTAFYEYLYNWIADEKLHVSDIKSAYDLKYAKEYLRLKDNGETNETARLRARVFCEEDIALINTYKHGLDVIVAWEKSVARYIDAVRSTLSWEKTMGNFSN